MKKIARFYIRLEDILTNCLMIGVVIFVFISALLRWFGHPIEWTAGFAQLLFVWVIFLGANKALRQDKHIGVDFFVKRLPQKARNSLEIIISLLTLVFLLYISFHGLQLSIDNVERRVSNLDISYSFVTLAVPVGCILMSITLINKLIAKIMHTRKTNPSETKEG